MDSEAKTVNFIRWADWQGLPAEVQQKSKLALLDALGAAISGTLTPISRITASYAARTWRGDEATIILREKRANAIGAAFANAYATNGFDSDDGAIYTRGHPGAQLIPTALALSEKLKKSGSEMLTAIVVGYEVAIRTARCWHDYHNVYQSCGSWGSVADAAAAAHLLGLREKHIRNALGIAEYHAPNLPMMRDVDYPTMVKHGMGWGTITGITAAELASEGFTSIPTILSFNKYQDWVSDIGKNYMFVEGLTFKEFACCGWAHTAVLAAKNLKKEHDFLTEDIVDIHIETFHESIRLGASIPTTTEEAQYRTGWPVAAMLLESEVGPFQMRDERLTDEKMVSLAGKVTMVESETYSDLADKKYIGDPEGQYTSRVRITLADGIVLDSGEVITSHDYGGNWDEEELSAKFRWLVENVIDDKLVDELIEMVLSFETITDVHKLTDLLV